ncbi:MAG: class I SAM-dependent methyltransferase [Candidatus Tectimicrobiota bacterium]
MGFYSQYVLPRLINCCMQHASVTVERQRFIPYARGKVLEIGIGSGLNLPWYSSQVERLYGLDPSPALWALACQRRRHTSFPLTYLHGSAEQIPCATGSFDTVVSTWTLCTLPAPLQALQELRRVLQPAGRLIFVEHGLAPEPRVQVWQQRLTPVWKRLAGGCHLQRPIETLIRQAGFVFMQYETGYLPGPKPFAFLYKGLARPASMHDECPGRSLC